MLKFTFIAAIAVMLSGLAFGAEPTIGWETASTTISVSSEQVGQPLSFNIDVPQVMRWTERVPHDSIVCQDVPTEVPGLCTGYRCTDDGKGDSPLWTAYFSAPRSQKPAALAAAIKGVGEKSAQALVDARYFQRKPRSWESFAQEINAAADAKVIVGSVRYQVLVQYRSENLVNLGYAQGTCTEVQYQCMVPGTVQQCEHVTTYSDEPRSKVMQVITRGFSLQVNGAVLQSFETETFNVSAGATEREVSVQATTAYNRYSFNIVTNGNNGTITASATGRNTIRLPEDVNQGGVVMKSGNNVVLNVAVNPKYLPERALAARGDKLYVSYTVFSCKLNWTGTCGFSNYKEVERNEAELTNATTAIPLHVENGTKVYAKYKFARRGSALYDGTTTTESETKVLKNSK